MADEKIPIPERNGFAVPDVRAERAPDQQEDTATLEIATLEQSEQQEITIPTSPAAAVAAAPMSIPVAKDELTHQIEKVLEDDLADVYFQMGPEQQTKFKIEGERVTATIRQMIKSGVVKLKRILSLILNWLQMIPGVNVFFLEKEAKIKAEKILALREEFL